MKRIISLAMAVILSCMAAIAQLSDGFYRIHNKASERYMYVRDCTGEVSTLGADMDAIELWAGLDAAVSDPGSVIYIKKVGSSYDLTAQATGVHQLTGYYMNITVSGPYCMVYSSGQYLYEIGNNVFDKNRGMIGAKTNKEMPGKSEYRLWVADKVDSSTDNYFGFRPSVNADGKHYAPFIADFAYTPKNAGLKTWYVSKVDEACGVAVIRQIDGTVARGQAVIVECPSLSADGNKVDLTIDAGMKADGNNLVGAYFANGERSFNDHRGVNPAIIPFDPLTMRVLSTDADGHLAYVASDATLPLCDEVWDAPSKSWKAKKHIPHNQSYLTVSAQCPETLTVMTEKEYADFIQTAGVDGIEANQNDGAVYNMQGVRMQGTIDNLPKGVYIINNRKVMR